MNEKKNSWMLIVFFGSIWGILEATLGNTLQYLPPLVSGSIMFPIGAMIMLYAYSSTRSIKTIFFVALIAASIKIVNFWGGLPPIKTYNPMIAIILQSLVMMGVVHVIKEKTLPMKIVGLGVASLSWRILFLINLIINNTITGQVFGQLSSIPSMVQFVLTLGLLGAVFASILFLLGDAIQKRVSFTWKPGPVVAFSMMVIAVILTIII